MDEWRDLVDRAAEVGLRIAAASLLFVMIVVVGRLVRPCVRLILQRRNRPSYTRVMLGLYRVMIAVVGALVALTVTFPSVRVADVLAIFGIVSVAAGFAFRDTFENLLAGALLIWRDPFKSGDEVVVDGIEGRVEGVTVRETLLRTNDGSQVLVPNSRVMSAPIEVHTHERARRLSFTLHVDESAQFALVRTLAEEAMSGLGTALPVPSPVALIRGVVAEGVAIECRLWTGPTSNEIAVARDQAVEAVLTAYRENKIPTAVSELRIIPASSTTNKPEGT